MVKGPGGSVNWGTRIGVILAVMGSAVGLGNFLRFPGLAAQYEGGAFLIPYFIALFLLGMPIAWCEWAIGRYAGSKGYNSPAGIFYAIWNNQLSPYIGAFSAMVPVLIYCYYIHLEGWCLAYAWKYLNSDMGGTGAGAKALGVVSGMGEDGSAFNTAFIFVAVGFALNFFLIYRGVVKGIEWFNKFAMPALIVCAIVVLIRVLTLPPLEGFPERNVLNGLGSMWNPNWSQLANAQMWIDATGQIFFSLSVGFGLIMTYASYVKKDDDIALSALTSAAGNTFCEVALAGMMIVPAAFIFMGNTKLGSTLGLGFVTLPDVFTQMPMGRFIGFLFFFLLFLAAVTSSLSMLQPAIAMLEEGLGLTRKASVAILGFITAVGACFIGFFSKDLLVLDTVDFWIGTFSLYVLATVLVIIFGWVMGIDKGHSELNRGASIHIPKAVMFIIKYIAPVYLITLMGIWFYQNAIKPPGEGKLSRIQQVTQFQTYDDGWKVIMSLGFIALVAGMFMLLAHASAKQWKQRELAQKEISI